MNTGSKFKKKTLNALTKAIALKPLQGFFLLTTIVATNVAAIF